MRNSFFSAFGLLFLCLTASAGWAAPPGWNSIGPVTGTKPIPNGIEVIAGLAHVRISALAPQVIRVRYSLDGVFPSDHSFAVVKQTGFEPPAVRIQETAEKIELFTGEITVRITRAPSLQIAFLDSAGRPILQDDPLHPVSWDGAEFRIWKLMPPDEHYFGLGDKAGPIDHRDMAFSMWNTDAPGWQESTDPLYKTIPFFIGVRSGAAYGLFLDNTYRSSFDFGKEMPDAYSFGASGGELNYYFFYGPEPKKVLEEYTALTGRTPLPPRFALGYQQSRWSYFPESQVLEIARRLRQDRIPCDVIYLDIDYEQGFATFTVNRQAFPHFAQMIRQLAQQGFKVVAITDPHLKVEAGYAPFDEGLAHGYFVKNPDGTVYEGRVWPGESVFPEFTRADVRRWWGTLYADFVHIGIRGFWNDMNEPSVFRYPQRTMPLDTVFHVDGRITDQREIHNVYGLENVRATYDGLLALAPDLRPFVLTRAGYAGAQRYAATWSGDNLSTWNHLRMSVSTLLSLGISGYAFVGADVGGFGGSPTPELLTRWMELGAFQPFYRNHSSKGTRYREPWVDGPEQEAIRRRYIDVRYRLLPYIYTQMQRTSTTGVPLMRAMFLDFPDDPALATNDQEYMFGRDLLIAPRLFEFDAPYNGHLPKGDWYDFWTGQRFEGGKEIEVNPPLDTLPVYVRAGAIIPEQALVQDTDQIPQGPLELHIYPGPDCQGSIYDDDGDSFAYRHGVYFLQTVSCSADKESLRVEISPATGTYHPWWKTVQLDVQDVTKKPRLVSIDEQKVSTWTFSAEKKIVSVNLDASRSGTEVQIFY